MLTSLSDGVRRRSPFRRLTTLARLDQQQTSLHHTTELYDVKVHSTQKLQHFFIVASFPQNLDEWGAGMMTERRDNVVAV